MLAITTSLAAPASLVETLHQWRPRHPVELKSSRIGVLFDVFHARGFWNRKEAFLAGQECKRYLARSRAQFPRDSLEDFAQGGSTAGMRHARRAYRRRWQSHALEPPE